MPQLQYDYYDKEYRKVKSAEKTRSTRKTSRSYLRTDENYINTARSRNMASIMATLGSDDELYSSRSYSRPNPVRQKKDDGNKQAVMSKPQIEVQKRIERKSQKQSSTEMLRTKNNVEKNRVFQNKRNDVKKIKESKIEKKVNPKTKVKINKENKIQKHKFEKPREMSLKNAELMMDKNKKLELKAQKMHNVFRNITLSLIGFSILFLICYRSSVINESFKGVNKMKSELENIKTSNAQLESEIQRQTDLSNIEMYAKYQLGMQKPKESQIRKIVVEKKKLKK